MNRRIDRRPLRISGGAPFIPLQISGLYLWLRADMGITIATGVSVWADQSGNGDANRNAAQGTGANQPTYNATDANFAGKPSLTFAANSKLITGTWSVAIAQPATVFVVGKQDSATPGRYAMDSLSDPPQFALFGDGTNQSHQFAGVDNVVASTSSPKVTVLEYNGASSKQYLSSLTAAITGDAGTNGAAGLSIGNYAGSLANGGWTLTEILVYNSILSASNRALVTKYLGSRYGITIS